MSEQSNLVSISYAPNPLKVKRRLNKLAVVSLVGAIACAMIPVVLFVDMGLNERLHSLAIVIIPFIAELGVAGLVWRRMRGNRDYQRGQWIVSLAVLIAVMAALPSIYMSATVQDRVAINAPLAIDMLTVNKTWNAPAGARVVRTRERGLYIWYELKIPGNSVAAYQRAVTAQKGSPSSTASTVASLRALQGADPDWWDFSTMPDAFGLTFSGLTADTYIFSAKEGKVLVRQQSRGS